MDTKHFIVELQNFKISYYCWWWGKDLSLRPLGYKTNGIIAIFIIYVNMLELLMSFKITNSIPFRNHYTLFPKVCNQAKLIFLGTVLLQRSFKDIKQLTYAGCQSEIPLDSSRFRMNRKFCYQSATKFSTVTLTRELRCILLEWACRGLSDCEELVGVIHK